MPTLQDFHGSAQMRKYLSILKEPISSERQSLLKARWERLPPDLKTDWQMVGQSIVHCGYTMGASYCAFGCTHCYLPKNANRVPIPSLEEMKAQIDANRRIIGPAGGLQITGGDVVDAYWRTGRSGELIEIVRYANQVGVIPMLMTHGQILLEQPDYFVRLVREGGLRKIAIHIDMTQAGRPGYPIRKLKRECDLHPLREAFVDLIQYVRKQTGVRFYAAHTVTVTERNIDSICEIPRWLLADSTHLDAFRMVSFQTEANVGRTQFSQSPVTPDHTWSQICAGVGMDLPRDNLWFGHPDCNNMTTLMVVYPEGELINLIPIDAQSRAFWKLILKTFGQIEFRDDQWVNTIQRISGVLMRHPSTLWRALRYIHERVRREKLGYDLIGPFLRGDVRFLNIVIHNFMHAADVAARSGCAVIQKRLDACSFRGAVQRNGEWAAVPMCEINSFREELYSNLIADGASGISE